jgi:hypothetical protein
MEITKKMLRRALEELAVMNKKWMELAWEPMAGFTISSASILKLQNCMY